jgi:indolepyruvate ferredoxin oxidoreductase
MELTKATLEDKYTVERGRVFLTGTQALIRLLMLQRASDAAAGLNTAGFVSGYRGSPLGGLDLALARAQKHLERSHIRFQPGVNEDLAATAIWGTQQVTMFPKAKYDGVFGMWYGKGPGVDRCGDVFKHANAAGTAACWCSPATTTPPSPRPCRTSPSTSSRPASSRCSTRPTCRTTSTSGCTAMR